MNPEPANALTSPAPGGRVFELALQPGLADCAPSGRMRLDAIARWLQDVAYRDVEDCDLQHAAMWVLRRTRIRVERFPRFAEHCTARTFCSAIGRMWAERRTSLYIDGAAVVETVAVWVHLDPQTLTPTRLSDAELEHYQRSTGGREVPARLRHPRPSEQAPSSPWRFRLTDADLADHINNAVYWETVEEELLADADEPLAIDVELEHRSPAQPGPHLLLADGPYRWLTSPAGDEVFASVALIDRDWVSR